MKKDIHPEYHKNATITCACGNIIKTGSARKEMHVEICSACHPFYTGKENIIDTAGRVDRFRARAKKTTEIKEKKSPTKAESKEKAPEANLDNKAKLEKIRKNLDEK